MLGGHGDARDLKKRPNTDVGDIVLFYTGFDIIDLCHFRIDGCICSEKSEQVGSLGFGYLFTHLDGGVHRGTVAEEYEIC